MEDSLMAVTLEELEAQALKLSIKERSQLIHRLIVSIDGDPEGTPEEIAKAWEEEIARRVADMETGRTRWIPADEVMSRIRARIGAAKAAHAD
jgi:putative addiction module component (TIGR02574 family)